jgi:acyl-CoA thioesterase FadM
VTSTEHVVRTAPFTVRRRVKFGECDPAGVVYTPVFGEYVVSCADLFYEFLLDGRPERIKDEHGFETPSRALSLDFRSSLRPDAEFDMTVFIGEIRTRTYTLEITGSTLADEAVFIAQLTPICVARGERRAIEIPRSFRARLEAYRSKVGAAVPQGTR